jgi:predicted phosphodiesterase
MRVGLISDVHANLPALRTVLDRLADERLDRLLCLGDVVGYGGDPEACLALVRERADTVVMGNHDAAAAHAWARASFHSWAREAIEAHAAWLDAEALAFLAGLPGAVHAGNGGQRGLFLTHGTPGETYPFTYLTTAGEAGPALASFQERFGAVGHTHVPALFTIAPGSPRVELGDLEMELARAAGAEAAADVGRDAVLDLVLGPGTRAILNPGSVGQPRDGDPRASCMVLDVGLGAVRWLRLPYDVRAAQAVIRRRGLPEILAARLALGR